MDKFKGQPIEEVLRKQIQKGEYLDNGGSGVKPPGGGGGEGGSGGGSPNGPGGSDDEESYDTRQTIFASGALLSLVHSLSLRFMCSIRGQVNYSSGILYFVCKTLNFENAKEKVKWK